MMRRTLLILFILLQFKLWSQDPSQNSNFIANIIEDFLESTDAENFDFNTLFENLNYYYENNLNINSASEQDLRDLMLINEIQINNFISYRNNFGKFLSLYELQAIPSWDIVTIRNVQPFLKCTLDPDNFNLNFRDALTQGKSQIYLKGRRAIEPRRGFQLRPDGTAPYEGDPNYLYARYRYEYGQSFKVGFTMEKDPGEKLFGEASPYGFDFYSFFAYGKDINKTIHILSLGDYAVSMGQGLILHNDFGAGKSSWVMNVKRAGRTLRPYSSVNEVNFFRGAGTVINLSKNFQAAVFISHKPISGTAQRDTIENTDFDSFGSIRLSGLHRTQTEIENKNTIVQSNLGGQLEYRQKDLKLAVNGLLTQFNVPLVRDEQLYRRFQFSGTQLANVSIDYSYRKRNFTFFGESAMSDNKAMAHLHGVLMALDKRMDISLVYRNFSAQYQVINANAFSDATQPINEKGVYMGAELRPFRNMTVSSYVDIWSNPWVSYRRDGPAEGKDFLVRFQYNIRRKMDTYIQYRYVQRQRNTFDENIIRYPEDIVLQRLRLQFNYKLSKEWELRNRVEFSKFEKAGDISHGFLTYQDVLYKPMAGSFSFTGRYAVFDVQSFDARIYTYENDLLYEFFIPFFQNRGSRFYINARWRIARNYTWEFRVGRSFFQNVETLSSGNNLIEGRTLTELKTQLQIKF